MLESKSKLGVEQILFYFVFVPSCMLYYYLCQNVFPNIPGIFNYNIIPDHLHYLRTIRHINEGQILLSINNNVGISLIYIQLFKIFSFAGIKDPTLVSFIFNMLVLVFVFRYYSKMCDRLKLYGKTKLYFFFGVQFFYFSQLINKDLLTVLFFFISMDLLMQKKYLKLFLISLLFFFVRIQLVIFTAVCIFLSTGNLKRRFLLAYIGTSILAAYSSVKGGLISDETMGSGISAILISINKNFFYLGYLFFNPIRLLQFFIDIYRSFFIYNTGLIDVSRILRLPLLLLLTTLIKPVFSVYANLNKNVNMPIKGALVVTLSFTLTWLMNPTINSRYIMLVLPFLIILGRFGHINSINKVS